MNRRVTLRRSLEQAIHCLEEALSVVENQGEDARCAYDDVEAAIGLLTEKIKPELFSYARGMNRAVADYERDAKFDVVDVDEEDEGGAGEEREETR